MMTEQEQQLASSLLKQAADVFANHGCNDYKLDNTPENVDLLNRIEEWNVGYGKPEHVHVFDPTKKDLYTSDWLLMSYLSDRLHT